MFLFQFLDNANSVKFVRQTDCDYRVYWRLYQVVFKGIHHKHCNTYLISNHWIRNQRTICMSPSTINIQGPINTMRSVHKLKREKVLWKIKGVNSEVGSTTPPATRQGRRVWLVWPVYYGQYLLARCFDFRGMSRSPEIWRTTIVTKILRFRWLVRTK